MAGNGSTTRALMRPTFPELDEFYDTFRDLVESTIPSRLRRRLLPTAEPAIDMFEREGNIVVKAEMPGIPPEKIDITVADGELRISGERSEEKEVKEQDYYRAERQYGRIFRAIALPEGCDTENVSATAKDGVVEVVIPRKAQATTKKVQVKTAA